MRLTGKTMRLRIKRRAAVAECGILVTMKHTLRQTALRRGFNDLAVFYAQAHESARKTVWGWA
jgi:hypothetical protein